MNFAVDKQPQRVLLYLGTSYFADVVELADTLDSGSSSVKRVQVQVLSSAPIEKTTC